MYKVFISERPLLIRPREGAQVDLKGGELHFHCYDRDDLLKLVEMMEESPQITKVSAYNNDPAGLFSALKKEYKVVEAAGGLVENNEGDFLFIFRRGKWDLPKGKIDKGEDPEEAAVREVSEECGISAPRLGKLLDITYHTYSEKGKKILKPTYWYAMKYEGNEPLIPQEEEDISEVRWVSPEEFGEVLSNTYASIKELIEQRLLEATD